MGTPGSLRVLPAQPRMKRLADGALRLAAPAKINLNLLVGPRDADGYHPLDSFVARITLYDRIELRARPDGEVAFRCRGADCGEDEKNLAFRAACLLKRQEGLPGGVDIELAKGIPPGKGLGGGSSDAAAVLCGLDELWGLGLPAARLSELAAQLGSDVPLFLGPPCCRMTGRGERIQPLAVHPFVAVLLLGDGVCPTGEVYRAYDRLPVRAGRQIDAELLAGSPPSAWRGSLENQLSQAARDVCPALRDLWARLTAAVDLPVCLTGSGSGLFILCDDRHEAAGAVTRLPEELRRQCLLVRRGDE